MPFTVSHLAAALPFRRLRLVWSAFLIGSVAPDFPYVLATTDYRDLGHRFPGLIEFTFPAAIAALWLFHQVIKLPAVGLLPVGIQRRLQAELGEFKFGPPARLAAILFSLTLGIVTHVVWDAFTHAFTWPWRRWLWLQAWIRVPLFGRVPMYMFLQYASTIIGLIALGIWFLLWYRDTTPSRQGPVTSHEYFPLAMLAVAIVAGLLRALLVIGMPKNLERLDAFLLVSGVTALALVFWQVFLYCLMISTHQTWTMS